MMNVIKELQKYESTKNLDNIYTEPLKAKNLDIYLSSILCLQPNAILIGDTPVFHGSRKTGIPFTDEYKIGNENIQLLQKSDIEGHKIINQFPEKTLDRERVAGIVWNELMEEMNNIVLWNIFPFYPHEEDNYSQKRKVTSIEGEIGFHFLELILKEIPSIQILLVAGETAAQVIAKHEELKKTYAIYYVNSPSLSAKNEFISRIKNALKYKQQVYEKEDKQKEHEVVYEYYKYWAEEDESGYFYCRALNEILDPKLKEYCQYCPCNLNTPLYCGYYDFRRKALLSPKVLKQRNDLLIQAGLMPLFPDYKIRIARGELLLEKAFQDAAKIYVNRVGAISHVPYLFELMKILAPFVPYMKVFQERREEMLVAILFHNLLRNTYMIHPERIEKDYGSYVRSLIDPEAREHQKNLKEAWILLKKSGLPENLQLQFQKIFQMHELDSSI